MLKKILPLLFLIVGAGLGVGAGLFLRPDPPPAEAAVALDATHDEGEAEASDHGGDHADARTDGTEEELGAEYVKMNNQFVVPIVRDRDVVAMVVLSLSLEVGAGQKDLVFQHEPKLRDSFLQVLFDHANIGGFEGAFTEAGNLGGLRNALQEVAQKDMGKDVVHDVLILEISRQDY
jgi:flagellar protein FliL